MKMSSTYNWRVNQSYDGMSTEVIAIIAGVIGAALSGVFNWLVSKTKTSGDERTAFRDSILERLNNLEAKQDELENEIMIWKGRYWSLYTWLVNFCLANGIKAHPPSFHEMEYEDLKKQFNSGGSKKKKPQQKDEPDNAR